MKRIDPLHIIAALPFIGVVILIGFLVWRATQPPRLTYESLSVRNVTPVSAEVVATTVRRPIEGCTNGIQADLKAKGVVARLPVPLRAQTPGRTSYALVLPSLRSGPYEVKVRESFICPGKVQTVESPWIAFEVTP